MATLRIAFVKEGKDFDLQDDEYVAALEHHYDYTKLVIIKRPKAPADGSN